MTPTERLAALGLTAERPVAWISASPELSRAECDESLRLIETRTDADGRREYRAVARTPEGDAVLLSTLGLDRHPVGWARMTDALHEAQWRGLCRTFRDRERSDGRWLVVAATDAGEASWQALGSASAEAFDALPVRDSVSPQPQLVTFQDLARVLRSIAEAASDELSDALVRLAHQLDPATPARFRPVALTARKVERSAPKGRR
jgi:hypothetical protein